MVSATYHVTWRCNLRCVYCELPTRGPELDTAGSLALIGALRDRGVARLGLSGGEPLLREDLGQLIRAARSGGMVVSVVTNATFLPARLDLVREVDALVVSLDGGETTHDRHRGAGVYRRTHAGIRAALEAGLRVSLMAVVSEFSEPEIDETLRFAESLGVRVFFQPVLSTSETRDRGGDLPEQDHRRLFALLEQRKRAGRPIGNSWGHVQGAQRDPAMPVPGPCPAARFVFAVMPDGHLTPCCENPGTGFAPRGATDLETLGERLDALRAPACDRCTTVGNVEVRRLLHADPRALWSTFRMITPPRI